VVVLKVAHFGVGITGLRIVFVQQAIAEGIGGIAAVVVLDIQSGPIERQAIRSLDFEDDARTLERHIHELAIGREC